MEPAPAHARAPPPRAQLQPAALGARTLTNSLSLAAWAAEASAPMPTGRPIAHATAALLTDCYLSRNRASLGMPEGLMTLLHALSPVDIVGEIDTQLPALLLAAPVHTANNNPKP